MITESTCYGFCRHKKTQVVLIVEVVEVVEVMVEVIRANPCVKYFYYVNI